MNKPPRVVMEFSQQPTDEERALPESIEDWLTYRKQNQRGYKLIFLTPRDEIRARRDLMKV